MAGAGKRLEKEEYLMREESWFVVHTSPRAEKKVAERLEEIGVTTYCPVRTERRQWSDRIKKVTKPLIPSTIFVKLPEQQRNRVFEVRGALRYMFWMGRPAKVREEEIDTMKTWLANDHVDLEVTELTPGDRLTIPKGPFKGQTGRVAQLGPNKIQLILEAIGLKITIAT